MDGAGLLEPDVDVADPFATLDAYQQRQLAERLAKLREHVQCAPTLLALLCAEGTLILCLDCIGCEAGLDSASWRSAWSSRGGMCGAHPPASAQLCDAGTAVPCGDRVVVFGCEAGLDSASWRERPAKLRKHVQCAPPRV